MWAMVAEKIRYNSEFLITSYLNQHSLYIFYIKKIIKLSLFDTIIKPETSILNLKNEINCCIRFMAQFSNQFLKVEGTCVLIIVSHSIDIRFVFFLKKQLIFRQERLSMFSPRFIWTCEPAGKNVIGILHPGLDLVHILILSMQMVSSDTVLTLL